MAFAVRGATNVSGSGTSVTINKPTGAQAGDSLVLVIAHDPNIQVQVSGMLGYINQLVGTPVIRVLAVLNSVPDSLTVSFLSSGSPATSRYSASLLAFEPSQTNAITSAVVNVQSASASSNTQAVVPSLTSDSDGILVSIAGWSRGTTWTTPGGTVERADLRSGDTPSDISLWVGTSAVVAGATGTRTITNDNPFAGSAVAPIVVGLVLKSALPEPVWNGDLSTGDFSQYLAVHGAQGDSVELRSDTPPADLANYVRLRVRKGDVFPLTPTSNPRAQLDGPVMVPEHSVCWISWYTRFPSDFPAALTPLQWLLINQLHGPPYNGSPRYSMTVVGGYLQLNMNNITYWRTPVVKAQWQAFAVRTAIEKDPTKGWVELWYSTNGSNLQRQLLWNGKYRVYARTLADDQNSGLKADSQLYLSGTWWDDRADDYILSLDQAGLRVDTLPPPMIGIHVATDAPTRRRVG